jgi:asparagine synthetase B (glutamine-hydrolysing)
VQGRFSFVIYDEMAKRVFAGRDPEGSQPLFWGATDEGSLLFGSSLDDLEECNPTATMFPAGEGGRGWGKTWQGVCMLYVCRNLFSRCILALPKVWQQCL